MSNWKKWKKDPKWLPKWLKKKYGDNWKYPFHDWE